MLQELFRRPRVGTEVRSATRAPSGMSASAATLQSAGVKEITPAKLASGAGSSKVSVMSEVAPGALSASTTVPVGLKLVAVAVSCPSSNAAKATAPRRTTGLRSARFWRLAVVVPHPLLTRRCAAILCLGCIIVKVEVPRNQHPSLNHWAGRADLSSSPRQQEERYGSAHDFRCGGSQRLSLQPGLPGTPLRPRQFIPYSELAPSAVIASEQHAAAR